MKRCLYPLCASIAFLLPVSATAICGAPQPRLVCAEYSASQLVVEATLVKTEQDAPEYPSFHVYTLSVNRTLRGKVAGNIRVYEGNDSGRASFDWVPGREYLLFLSYVANDHTSWELDGCGNSGPLSAAKITLSQIAAVKTARGGGVIHGQVRGSEALPATPIPGVRVEASGTTSRYSAMTNEKGEFEIKVPAGQYVVRATRSGMTFDKADFSYEDPRRVRIEPGGCAQIELAEIKRTSAR